MGVSDPRTRLGLALAVGLVGVVLDRPASLGLLAGASLAVLAVAPVPPGWRRRVLGVSLAVVASTAWAQGLFYAGAPRTPWLALGPLVVWREGIAHGLVQSLRLVAAGVAGATLALTTPPDRLFTGLIAVRVPHGAAFLAVTALRFVPVVAAEWIAVRQARDRRGRPIWARSPIDWLRQEMALLAPVAARAVRRARTLAETLDARGFDPVVPRALRAPLAMPPGERIALAAVALGVAALWLAHGLFALYTLGVWYRPELRPLYAVVRAWL